MKRIRKNYSGVVPNGKVLNTKNNSLEDTYSCNYLNDNIPVVDNMGSIVVDDIECKNILPNNSYSTVMGGVTITRNADGSITFNGTASSTFNYYLLSGYHFKLKAGIYTLSLHKNGEISGTALLSFFNQSDVATLISNMNLATNNSITATTENDLDLKSVLLYVVVGCTFNNFTIYPMLEKGPVATDYVEHKEFSNKQIYSTEEQIIGKWIDKKPLYRKVLFLKDKILISKTALSLGTIPNIENVVKCDCNVQFAANKNWAPIPFAGLYANQFSINDIQIQYVVIDTEKEQVYIQPQFGSNASQTQELSKIILVIEYTKTTD